MANECEETASAPTIATLDRLPGSYTLMMVDPDVPMGNGSTVEFLHWMQSGFTSASVATQIGGQTVFKLELASNTSALAAYVQPGPPPQVPFTHRYVQMLLNTTGQDGNLTELAKFAANRGGFDANKVVQTTGFEILMGNSFNVTADTTTATNSTGAAATTTGAAKGTKSTGNASPYGNSTTADTGKKGGKAGKAGKDGNSTTTASTNAAASNGTEGGKKSGGGKKNKTDNAAASTTAATPATDLSASGVALAANSASNAKAAASSTTAASAASRALTGGIGTLVLGGGLFTAAILML
jgi:phosphatidylethanolamine-binding protein (PEBP) family uncharacterized protein